MPYQALIFDMDGVITESVELHYRAWKRLTDEEGIPFDRALNDRLRGLARRDSLEVILRDQPPRSEAALQALMARKNGYFLELVDSLSPADVLPGVREIIAEARARGMKVAVGSSSQNAPLVLGKLGLHDAFDVIGYGHSVVNAKPAPDIFLWVAGRLNVHPREAIVIEDGAAGIQAARRGGFSVVGVGTGGVQSADLVLRSLADAPLSFILDWLTAQHAPG